MATARKKQDEKHLRILRELVSLPANKQCFDCHQRGPTYVNMTIGSFVCTSCSGMLRGLTPPHRVKSISMASFSPEEVELVRSRGNEYCRQVWLALFDVNHGQDAKDEQQIKDFMVAKYEKKRYYVDPAVVPRNGPVNFSPPETQARSRTSTPTPIATIPETKPLPSLLGPQSKTLTLNVQTSTTPADNMFTPDKSSSEFLADFGSADPFSSSSQQFVPNSTQPSFANFENNPIFNASSMPTSATLSTLCNSVTFPSPARKSASSMGVGGLQQPPLVGSPTVPSRPPAEDRYAALKDLDSLMKTQQAVEPQMGEWAAAPAGSGAWPVSSSANIATSSVFGSPSQTGFLNSSAGSVGMQGFSESGSTANPFTGGSANPWVPTSGSNGMPSGTNPTPAFSANPFRTVRPAQPTFGMGPDGGFGWSTLGVNGVPNGQIPNGVAGSVFPTSQSMNFPAKAWHANPVGNPFVLGASPAPTGHSSNPFL